MSDASSCSELTPQNYDEVIATNALQASTITKLEQEVTLYKFQLDQLQQHLFGKRSEKQYPDSPEQKNLFEGETPETNEEEDYEEVAAHKRKRRSAKSIPIDLPIDEVVYEPHETHCSDCGEELREFSRDVREELEFRPARFFKLHHVTSHCSCPKCDKVYSGEVPLGSKPVIAGSQAGPQLLAHIVTSRICDHLPYYRQSQMYEREGVFIPDKTLSRYGLAVGALLEPVARGIKAHLLKLQYLQADETHLDVLDKEKSPNTHRGQLWVLNDANGSLTYYEYHKGRDMGAAKSLLGDYNGTLQTDAYACYNDHPGVRLGCMAHGRRYFVKAKKLAPKECRHVMQLVGQLYKIERELKKKRGKLKEDKWFEKRKTVRQQLALPLLEKLKEYLLVIKDKWLLEAHPLYKAIHYMLNRFDSFVAYTTDGRYEIDNNDVERMIRPIAIGRRNWLFAGSHHGANMAAVMMTVVQTCKQLKVNPQQYLAYVLPRLADQRTTSLDGLMPFDWAQA